MVNRWRGRVESTRIAFAHPDWLAASRKGRSRYASSDCAGLAAPLVPFVRALRQRAADCRYCAIVPLVPAPRFSQVCILLQFRRVAEVPWIPSRSCSVIGWRLSVRPSWISSLVPEASWFHRPFLSVAIVRIEVVDAYSFGELCTVSRLLLVRRIVIHCGSASCILRLVPFPVLVTVNELAFGNANCFREVCVVLRRSVWACRGIWRRSVRDENIWHEAAVANRSGDRMRHCCDWDVALNSVAWNVVAGSEAGDRVASSWIGRHLWSRRGAPQLWGIS